MTQISNLVHQRTSAEGTGNITLSALAGRQSFYQAFGTGGSDMFFYFISHTTAAEWEIGTGHLQDVTTLVRDTIIASSNSGAAVNFSTGEKDVINDIPAQYQAILPIGLSSVSGLQTALDEKAPSSHTHLLAQISDAGTMAAQNAADYYTALQTDTALAAKQNTDTTLTALAAHNANGLLTQTATDSFTGRTLTAGTGISVSNGDGVAGNPTISVSNNTLTATFGMTIDGGGAAITTGVKGYLTVPYAMTITGWDILADQSGSIVVDVWKDNYANFPPTVADTIAGTEKPMLTSAQKNQDNSLSTWTTTVSAGDIIGFNVDSATTVTRVTVIIKGIRS